MIIPIFIPHQGCPYRCVFCNQDKITGATREEDIRHINSALETYLLSRPVNDLPPHREVAFYGGTFTGLPAARQEFLFSLLAPYMKDGLIHRLRISTHARFVDTPILERLKGHRVETIELGVQSTDPEVLRRSGRIDDKQTLPKAIHSIRQFDFDLGLQIMLGLPGDDERTFFQTVKDVIGHRPDFVRIYPTLVIRGTELHDLYLRGDYRPWTLRRTVSALKQALQWFEGEGVRVIRMGLHPEPGLLENLVEGPYHPSLRSLVHSEICYDEMASLIQSLSKNERESISFAVPWKRISHYTGHRKSNIDRLKRQFGFKSISVVGRKELNSLQCT